MKSNAWYCFIFCFGNCFIALDKIRRSVSLMDMQCVYFQEYVYSQGYVTFALKGFFSMFMRGTDFHLQSHFQYLALDVLMFFQVLRIV